jgi:hypothetical protein
MPVHFTVASHEAQPIERASRLTKPEGLPTNRRITRCAELLQSSFVGKGVDLSTVFGTASGFVDTPQLIIDIIISSSSLLTS